VFSGLHGFFYLVWSFSRLPEEDVLIVWSSSTARQQCLRATKRKSCRWIKDSRDTREPFECSWKTKIGLNLHEYEHLSQPLHIPLSTSQYLLYVDLRFYSLYNQIIKNKDYRWFMNSEINIRAMVGDAIWFYAFQLKF